MKETIKLKTRERIQLEVDVYQPEGQARAVLVVVHGMAEHKKRYQHLGEYLSQEGILVYIYDQRGSGASRVSTLPLGMISYHQGWELLKDDVAQMLSVAHSRHAGLPVFLLGHSMGSLLARCIAKDHGHKLAGLILSGTAKDPGLSGHLGAMLASVINLFQDKKKPSPFLDGLLFKGVNERIENPRTSFDWLSRDEAVIDDYISDPLSGYIYPASFYLELIKGVLEAWRQDTFAQTDTDLPILFISGDADPVGDYGQAVEQAVAAYKEEGQVSVDAYLYEGGRHEMFNEINHKEVFRDLENWINEVMVRQDS